MRRLVLLLAAAALVAGCGSGDGGEGESDTPATSLTIVFHESPNAKARNVTLECDPVGGTIPEPEQVCAKLAALANPFAPTPKGVACTELYGGPQTATVEGTLDGRPVSTTFTRKNGCEIERWSRHIFLLPFGAMSLGPA